MRMTPKDVTQPRDKDGALNLLNCLTIKRENNPSNIETSKVKIIVHNWVKTIVTYVRQ